MITLMPVGVKIILGIVLAVFVFLLYLVLIFRKDALNYKGKAKYLKTKNKNYE